MTAKVHALNKITCTNSAQLAKGNGYWQPLSQRLQTEIENNASTVELNSGCTVGQRKWPLAAVGPKAANGIEQMNWIQQRYAPGKGYAPVLYRLPERTVVGCR